MLSLAGLHAHLSAKPHTTGEETFGPGVYAYKLVPPNGKGKVFAILGESDKHLTLKCDPVLSEHMRAQYAAITPGYHTNKRLWITIRQDKDLPDAEVKRLIDHAYDQVRAGLTRKARAALDALDQNEGAARPRHSGAAKGGTRNPARRQPQTKTQR